MKKKKRRKTAIPIVTVYKGCVECVTIRGKKVAYKVKDLDTLEAMGKKRR